jgi:hypothetical protein
MVLQAIASNGSQRSSAHILPPFSHYYPRLPFKTRPQDIRRLSGPCTKKPFYTRPRIIIRKWFHVREIVIPDAFLLEPFYHTAEDNKEKVVAR